MDRILLSYHVSSTHEHERISWQMGDREILKEGQGRTRLGDLTKQRTIISGLINFLWCLWCFDIERAITIYCLFFSFPSSWRLNFMNCKIDFLDFSADEWFSSGFSSKRNTSVRFGQCWMIYLSNDLCNRLVPDLSSKSSLRTYETYYFLPISD